MRKVSDHIADFLADRGIRHVFGIVGAGNAHIFDSIARRGFTEIVAVHHEQAACMAMQTYFRTSGVITAALLTTGGGSCNGITGVVSAWMDSIPGVIISGNENSKFTQRANELRIWGVQGFDSIRMVSETTKRAVRLMEPAEVLVELDRAFSVAGSGRPGPCWLDVPMNVQAALTDPYPIEPPQVGFSDIPAAESMADIDAVIQLLQESERPLLWLGHGIRLSGGVDLIPELLQALRVPALISWAGIDMVESGHELVFGRAGVYGQRAANFILQNCDLLIAIGTRLAIPQVGYDLSEFARAAKVVVVDIDEKELSKHRDRLALGIEGDAATFIRRLLHAKKETSFERPRWLDRCRRYRNEYPWIGPEHDDPPGFINSYRFMDRLCDHLKPDQVIVTDMGTALLSGHQILRLKKGQRLMTSTGLGEMGYGLPGAVGASFARDRGEVLCLNCDGGMMLNLQELQTIVHHRLPIKIVVFNNDGYLMIKHTQKALFEGNYVGTDRASGVSCPDYSKVGRAFGIPTFSIRSWDDFENVIPGFQAMSGAAICEVFMHPEQLFVPKLSLAVQEDGTLVSPPLEDLSPLLERDELRRNMMIGLHPKSEVLVAQRRSPLNIDRNSEE